MKFLWPEFLALLLFVPLLAGLYVWLLRRRTRLAVRYGNLSLVQEALGLGGLGHGSPWLLAEEWF